MIKHSKVLTWVFYSLVGLILIMAVVMIQFGEVNGPSSRSLFENPPVSGEKSTPTTTKTTTGTPSRGDQTATPTNTSTSTSIPNNQNTMEPPANSTIRYDIPPEIAGHENEWPLANHDYANNRAAVGSSINAANVANLKIAWSKTLGGTSEWGAGTGSPIVSDGIVYFQDLGANTYAVELKSGKLLWETQYSNQIFGPSGPGIGYGKIFVISRIDRYSALDMKTGRELWQWSTGTQMPTGAFQPVVFDNQLYITTQAASSGKGHVEFKSYQGGSSGSVVLLDPETGRPSSWNWMVVEEGFWGNPQVNSGGGLWFPPAIDIIRGASYWGTGNPSPVPGIKGWPNGASRPGPNLYTNSLVALDHKSGEMLWYNQVKPHDLFNLDLQVSPMLATVNIDGKDRNIVIGSGKLGIIYAFDQDSGEIIWSTPVGLHQNDNLSDLPLDDSTTWVAPGAWGGMETPMSFADGTIYALTANLPSPYKQQPSTLKPPCRRSTAPKVEQSWPMATPRW